jgi:hypothetical protein
MTKSGHFKYPLGTTFVIRWGVGYSTEQWTVVESISDNKGSGVVSKDAPLGSTLLAGKNQYQVEGKEIIFEVVSFEYPQGFLAQQREKEKERKLQKIKDHERKKERELQLQKERADYWKRKEDELRIQNKIKSFRKHVSSAIDNRLPSDLPPKN